jgi:hypothetical protein
MCTQQSIQQLSMQTAHNMATSRIVQLAQLIASETQTLDEHLIQNKLPQPSFALEAPLEPFPQASPNVAKAKASVIEATIELRQLIEGPIKLLLPEVRLL